MPSAIPERGNDLSRHYGENRELLRFSSSRFCLTQRRKVTKLKMARFVFLAALCESRKLLRFYLID